MKLLIVLFLAQIIGANAAYKKTEAFPNLSFQRPLHLLTAGDVTNRLFVIEQKGIVSVFPNKPDVKRNEVTTFLDITPRVSTAGNEEGLLGIAFDPKYKTNGRFYVYYSVRSPRRSRLSRFTVSGNDINKADHGSEEVLLEIPQPFSNHNGGMIEFGSDGMLYIGTGDGGGANDAGNPPFIPGNNSQNREKPFR